MLVIDNGKYRCKSSLVILERNCDLTHSLSNMFPRSMKQGTEVSFLSWPTWMLPYSGKATKISLSLSHSLSLAPIHVLQDRSRTLKSPRWNNHLNFAQYGKNCPTAEALKWKSFENCRNKSWWRKAQRVTYVLWGTPAQWHYSKRISEFCFCTVVQKHSYDKFNCRNDHACKQEVLWRATDAFSHSDYAICVCSSVIQASGLSRISLTIFWTPLPFKSFSVEIRKIWLLPTYHVDVLFTVGGTGRGIGGALESQTVYTWIKYNANYKTHK